MNLPSVSIIVPVYNVEPYVEDCIRSVMRQTYEGPIECIIVDDCGTDNSMAVVDRLITNYNGPISFKVLHHEHNCGQSAARNTGIDVATGDYLFFMDSDDEITKDCILKMTEQVFIYPQIELIQGLVKSIPDKLYYHLDRYQEVGYKDNNLWIRHEFYKWEEAFPCNVWNKLIKKEFIRTNNLFFMENVIYEDEHWMFRVVQFLNKYIVISDNTYIHYIRPNSIMRSIEVNPQKGLDCSYLIILDLIPQIDHIFRGEQIKKLIWLYLNKYLCQGGGEHINELKNRLCKELMSEHMYIVCVLLWLTVRCSNIKGSRRIYRLLMHYLERID